MRKLELKKLIKSGCRADMSPRAGFVPVTNWASVLITAPTYHTTKTPLENHSPQINYMTYLLFWPMNHLIFSGQTLYRCCDYDKGNGILLLFYCSLLQELIMVCLSISSISPQLPYMHVSPISIT